MKPIPVAALCLLAIAGTLAIEETRIASLRSRLEAAQAELNSAPATPASATTSHSVSTSPDSRPSRTERPTVSTPAPDSGQDPEGFSKTVRKMWDNPAGKSMMNQGVKVAVAMMYDDFIESLELTKEEADYFRGLLGAETATQQELGMKLMSASPEERDELLAEMKKRQKENEEAIRTFLNNPEDEASFKSYKERLPERQQLDGIRTALAATDSPLDSTSEAKLIDAMHRARTQSGAPDLSGAAGMEALAAGNISETFERGWEAQQSALRNEVGEILNQKQQEAFFEYQKQMKEFQLMSINMAEKMMKPSEKTDAE